MNKYVYIKYGSDPLVYERTFLFACEAENILDADLKFKAATGIDASKTTTVGCVVHDQEWTNDAQT